MTLAIGYVCLALAGIVPKFVKNEDKAQLSSFFLAIIAMVFFVHSLVMMWFY